MESDDGVGCLDPETFDVEEEGRVRFERGGGEGGGGGRVGMMGEEQSLIAASEARKMKKRGGERYQLSECEASSFRGRRSMEA